MCGCIAPQVVFEILSPGNTAAEMARKFAFYQTYGVEEYYLFDPDGGTLQGWLRRGDRLVAIPDLQDWCSPRLGIRFDLGQGQLVIYRPDGDRFNPTAHLVGGQVPRLSPWLRRLGTHQEPGHDVGDIGGANPRGGVGQFCGIDGDDPGCYTQEYLLGHDVLTVQEAGQANQRIPDHHQVLEFAMGQGRAVLTINRDDFIRLHRLRPDH